MGQTLVAIDDSEPAWAALEYALIARSNDELTAIHVLDTDSFGIYQSLTGGSSADFEDTRTERKQEVETLLDRVRDRAEKHGMTLTTETSSGRPERAIVAYAEDHPIDEIVIGSHGRTGGSRILLGSVAEKVVRRSPVPVTIVR